MPAGQVQWWGRPEKKNQKREAEAWLNEYTKIIDEDKQKLLADPNVSKKKLQKYDTASLRDIGFPKMRAIVVNSLLQAGFRKVSQKDSGLAAL